MLLAWLVNELCDIKQLNCNKGYTVYEDCDVKIEWIQKPFLFHVCCTDDFEFLLYFICNVRSEKKAKKIRYDGLAMLKIKAPAFIACFLMGTYSCQFGGITK